MDERRGERVDLSQHTRNITISGLGNAHYLFSGLDPVIRRKCLDSCEITQRW